MVNLIKAMMIIRWISLGWFLLTVFIYLGSVSYLMMNYVDIRRVLTSYIRNNRRRFDASVDLAESTCSICLMDFKEEPEKEVI